MKYSYLAAIFTFLSLISTEASYAVIQTSRIETVVNKNVLDSSDFEVIDEFVNRAILELLNTDDFSTVSSIRSTILRFSSSNKASARDQYSNAFFDSVYKHIGNAFAELKTLESAERRKMILINLLILSNQLNEPRLTEYTKQYLDNKDITVRYWALQSVTNPSIIKYMNSGGGDGLLLARDIASRILERVGSASAEELSLMLRFARGITLKEGDTIILRIADVRINRYANWNVDYELFDAALLRSLYNELVNADVEKQKTFGRRFCILFSYIFQRYIKGVDILNDTHKRYLESVMVDVERNCVSNALNQAQITIKQAIEGDSLIGLLEEHNRLLGDETRAGELPVRFNCDYGNNSEGNSRMYPPELPELPR